MSKYMVTVHPLLNLALVPLKHRVMVLQLLDLEDSERVWLNLRMQDVMALLLRHVEESFLSARWARELEHHSLA